MLYFLYGTNRQKLRTEFQKLREKFVASGITVETIPESGVSKNMLDGAVASRGLFGEKTLFIFDGILEKKDEQEIVASCAQELAVSPNIFLIVEPGASKDFAADVIAHATEVFEHMAPKVDTRPAFNIFSLGDALGKRNKKDLWVLYQQAVESGFASEEISNTLFWAVKNLALMKSAKPGDDAGLNPFVAKKTRDFAKNYSDQEIKNLSHALIVLHHEAHRGGESMDIALEKFILNL